jgi:hypothetical protein
MKRSLKEIVTFPSYVVVCCRGILRRGIGIFALAKCHCENAAKIMMDLLALAPWVE